MTGSKQILCEYYSLCEGGVCKDLLNEQEKADIRDNGAMYITGIAQRADHINGNGRVYPRHILEREVGKYQLLVQQRRSLGECVDPQTEIFTTHGWKYIKDITEDEEVFTFNEEKKLCVEKISRKIVLPFSGKMYHFLNKKKSIDMMLTPNHNILLFNREHEQKKVLTEDAFYLWKEKNSAFSHSYLKRNGIKWENEFTGNRFFVLPGDIKNIPLADFAAFMGIYLSEGCYLSTKRGYAVSITQKKENTTNEIRELLQKLPFHFTEYQDKNKKTTFYITDKFLKEYLKPLGKSYQKYIPNELKTQWNIPTLEILLTWFLKGDGRNRLNGNKTSTLRELYTTSEKLSQDFIELFLKIGSCASIQIREQQDRLIENRLIKKENSRPLYIVNEVTSNPHFDERFLTIKEVPYDGLVYCVTTVNGNWLMRRNNCIVWTYNCDHPEETVINLRNASHIVTNIWWEGQDVMVKMKVLSTPSGQIVRSLVNDGVAIGLSSRGLGSVKEVGKKLVVEDDYSMICFDVVAEPSTQGAFMRMAENKAVFRSKENKIKEALLEVLKR